MTKTFCNNCNKEMSHAEVSYSFIGTENQIKVTLGVEWLGMRQESNHVCFRCAVKALNIAWERVSART